MRFKGVKFYSAVGLSSGHNLERAEDVINQFQENIEYSNINQIIEFYNIQCFFRNKIFLLKWNDVKKEKYNEIVQKFSKHIGKFYSKINDYNLGQILKEVDFNYVDDFWVLFDKYKVYKRISSQCFTVILQYEKLRIHDILACKEIIKCFGSEIREYLIIERQCAEILLDQYAAFNENDNNKYYFPVELTQKDKENILINYINWEQSNLNYLKLIYESQSTNELLISDKVKLEAKRRYNEEIDKLFQESSGIEYGAKVSFCKNQEEEKRYEFIDREIQISYSSEWIKENSDYPTLLNNFIYLFEFVDMQFRIQHVHKRANLGIFEGVLGIKGKKEYFTGTAFSQMQILATVQTIGYYFELKRNNIRLEDILKWFFETYLETEFQVKGFYIYLPSENSTYLEKCRTIVSEIDSILKQFKLYVEEGEIDSELLQLSSEHLFFNNIPSLLEKKYIYPKGDEYNIVSHRLFSDQSMLHYVNSIENHYNSFYNLIQKENVRKEDFEEYKQVELDWLLEQEYVYLDKAGVIRLKMEKVLIIKDLYYNDVISRYYFSRYSNNLTEMEIKGMLEYESSLLSRPEQDYFNYLLNKSDFSNGLDLRNKYVHGTQPTDERIHKNDYFTFLRILVLLVIKINEEFCLIYDKPI